MPTRYTSSPPSMWSTVYSWPLTSFSPLIRDASIRALTLLPALIWVMCFSFWLVMLLSLQRGLHLTATIPACQQLFLLRSATSVFRCFQLLVHAFQRIGFLLVCTNLDEDWQRQCYGVLVTSGCDVVRF